MISVRLSEPEKIERLLKLLDAGDMAGIKNALGENIASIVDGQHRFRGLVTAWEENPDSLPRIPVMLHFGLDFIAEANLFNTINVTQRKLPKALIETTRGDITEADSASDKPPTRVSRTKRRQVAELAVGPPGLEPGTTPKSVSNFR